MYVYIYHTHTHYHTIPGVMPTLPMICPSPWDDGTEARPPGGLILCLGEKWRPPRYVAMAS